MVRMAQRATFLPHALQSKARVEFSTAMRAATGQTCNRAFDPVHARKIAMAMWTAVKITPGTLTDWERQIMTAVLVANSEITASLPPFNAMRQNPAPTSAELGKEMGQLVAQSSIDFA